VYFVHAYLTLSHSKFPINVYVRLGSVTIDIILHLDVLHAL
jgi:hypothetical protein